MVKRNFGLFAAVVCLLFAGFIFSRIQSFWQPEKLPVVIAVSKTPLSTPFYVAKSIDAFKNTCVDVEFYHVIGGQMAFANVMSGLADFGTISDSVIAFQSLAQKKFVSHATFVHSDNDVKLLSRPSAEIKTIADLRAKRIGVTKVTASEYFLSSLLAMNGMSVADVDLVNYKPEQLLTAYLNNEVDAIVPWEPFAFKSIHLLGNEINLHDTKNLNSLSFNLISRPADNATVNKAKCVIEGLAKAIDFISSKPQAAQNIVINELGLEPDFIDWVWPDYIFKLSLNQSLLLSIKAQALWLEESQVSDHKQLPQFNHFIDSRALLQVDSGAVTLSL